MVSCAVYAIVLPTFVYQNLVYDYYVRGRIYHRSVPDRLDTFGLVTIVNIVCLVIVETTKTKHITNIYMILF